MKTLNNHVLIFDKDCPLCKAYTGAFIKTGMLDSLGREAYTEMSKDNNDRIDSNRSRNEIALINKENGAVTYGIDSLFKIISHSYPGFKPLFNFKPFYWIMKKVYSFISYNRKVIIPAREGSGNCIPDLNMKYRWLYIISTWIITSMILMKYSNLLEGVLPSSRFFREFLICGGQIIFQSVILFFIARDKILTYLGNMMTISFAGGLLLLGIMGIGKLTGIESPLLYSLLFIGVAGLMFLEHFRRMSLLQIHWSASVGWVTYRVIILIFIL